MPREPRPLPPNEMVPQLTACLQKLGFRLMHKSATGSRYLRYPPSPFDVRISDHRWSYYSAQRFPQVIRVVRCRAAPMAELPLMALDIAIRFVIQIRQRQGLLGSEPAANIGATIHTESADAEGEAGDAREGSPASAVL